MKKIFAIFILSSLLLSCATVLKKKTYKLDISSNAANAKVKVYDSIYTLPSTIEVVRSNKDLDVSLLTDSLILDYKVKASPNPTFLYLNLIGLQAMPLNYAIDFTNKKRFYYGKSIFLDKNDTLRTIIPPASKVYHDYFTKRYPKKSGELYLHLSIPYVNAFYLKPNNESPKSNIGFFGFSAGLDYYHQNNQFLNFSFSGITDFMLPFPAPVDIDGEHEVMSSTYWSLSNNHQINRFTIGYGLSYSRNIWSLTNNESDESAPSTREPITKSHNALGLIFPGYFQSGKYFQIGIIYKPTFYRPEQPNQFEYEHSISLDLAWKIRLKK